MVLSTKQKLIQFELTEQQSKYIVRFLRNLQSKNADSKFTNEYDEFMNAVDNAHHIQAIYKQNQRMNQWGTDAENILFFRTLTKIHESRIVHKLIAILVNNPEFRKTHVYEYIQALNKWNELFQSLYASYRFMTNSHTGVNHINQRDAMRIRDADTRNRRQFHNNVFREQEQWNDRLPTDDSDSGSEWRVDDEEYEEASPERYPGGGARLASRTRKTKKRRPPTSRNTAKYKSRGKRRAVR